HAVRGEVTVNGQLLGAGDAAKLTGEQAVHLSGAKGAEVLVFDLPQ
ncbi:MAG: quercetin 2,3-dioxygenase, partial [Herminiimonas sp.]|nr:quercetin 2,3-dioxygenase [Herminiimonas sp.]